MSRSSETLKSYPKSMAGERVGWYSVSPISETGMREVAVATATVGEDGARAIRELGDDGGQLYGSSLSQGFESVASLRTFIRPDMPHDVRRPEFNYRREGGPTINPNFPLEGYNLLLGGNSLFNMPDADTWVDSMDDMRAGLYEAMARTDLAYDWWLPFYYEFNINVAQKPPTGIAPEGLADTLLVDPENTAETERQIHVLSNLVRALQKRIEQYHTVNGEFDRGLLDKNNQWSYRHAFARDATNTLFTTLRSDTHAPYSLVYGPFDGDRDMGTQFSTRITHLQEAVQALHVLDIAERNA